MLKIVLVFVVIPAILGLSRELMPQEAPSKLMLIEINNKQVLIEWAPVAESSVRGSFRGYLVRTWNEVSSQVYAFPSNITRASVEFLPNSKNFITVSVRNEKYVGPPSEAITFQAPQTEPNQPETFHLHALSDKSVFLKWTKPSRPNGILLGYTIYCSEIANDSVRYNQMSHFIDNPDKLQAKLTGMSAGITYRIEISALNCAGEGEKTFQDIQLGAHNPAKPFVPKFSYKINYVPTSRDECYKTMLQEGMEEPESEHNHDYDDYLLTNNETVKETAVESETKGRNCLVDCLILWLPDLENYPGEYFHVKYRQRGEKDFRITPPEMSEDFIILHEFDSCKNYEIILVAEDGEFSMESLPVLTPTVL